jgi:hypothetical protein
MTTKRKTHKQPNPRTAQDMPEFTYVEDHKIIYANSVQVAQNLYDFRLIFGLVSGVKNGKLQIANLESIILSPQHAKQLAEVLAENVRKYEEQYMPLPIPTVLKEKDTALVDVDTELG